MSLRLTERVDLDCYYDLDIERADDGVRRTITRDVFRAFYAHAASVGFECDGRPIGGVIFDGTSAHIAVHPDFFGLWGRLLQPMLTWLFGLRSEIVVQLESSNYKAIAFLERCGWNRIRECEAEVYFLITSDGAHPLVQYAASLVPNLTVPQE